EDLARVRAAEVEDVGDAGGQDAGLAGAGAGQHEDRPVERLDRLALLRIEVGQVGQVVRARGHRTRGDAAGGGGARWNRLVTLRFGHCARKMGGGRPRGAATILSRSKMAFVRGDFEVRRPPRPDFPRIQPFFGAPKVFHRPRAAATTRSPTFSSASMKITERVRRTTLQCASTNSPICTASMNCMSSCTVACGTRPLAYQQVMPIERSAKLMSMPPCTTPRRLWCLSAARNA